MESATTAPAIVPVPRPFRVLMASMVLIIGAGAVFVLLVPRVQGVVAGTSSALRAHPAFLPVALAVVALNAFEAVVHVVNAFGLWFNRALSRSPLLLRAAQHVEHLERRREKGEYLFMNALDAIAFAGAFAVSGEFGVFWAIVFGPHLATMVLAAWDLESFVKLYLLDVDRYLPEAAHATWLGRGFLKVHWFMRGAFVLTDAAARTFLCVLILRQIAG